LIKRESEIGERTLERVGEGEEGRRRRGRGRRRRQKH